MLEELSDEIHQALSKARHGQWRVQMGKASFPILRLTGRGFVLAAEDAPGLRGFVDLYDGQRHMFNCLVVACGIQHGEAVFEYKRKSPLMTAPPADFEQDAPTAP